MGEWRTVKLETLAASIPNAISTGPFGSAISSKFFKKSGTPVIRGSNLSTDIGVRFDEREFVFLDEDKSAEFSRSIARVDDLVFTSWGTVGQVGIISDESNYSEYVISNKQMKITPDPKKVDNLFLYYYMSAPAAQAYLSAISIGSSIPGFNLGQLKEFPVKLPDLATQREISALLDALDKCIVVNDRMRDTVGELVVAESQAWARQGGDPVPLRSIASWTKGVSYKSSEIVDESSTGLIGLKTIGRSGAFQEWGIKPFDGVAKKSQFVDCGDVVVACTDLTQAADVIGRAVRIPTINKYSNLVASLDLSVLRPRVDWPAEAIFGILANPQFRHHCLQYTSGTTVLHLSQEAFEAYKFSSMTDEQALTFARRISPQLRLADHLNEENLKLAKFRNAILPKLMDGTLSINTAEELVSGTV